MLGLDSQDWTALSTTALAVITAGLLGLGYRQIKLARDEARMNRTLQACEKYESDPLLDGVLRRLREAHDKGKFRANPSAFKADVIVLLNYLDSIAIGLNRDLYNLNIVCDHHYSIFLKHYEEYLGPSAPKIDGVDKKDFECLVTLCTDWCSADPRKKKRGLVAKLKECLMPGPRN